MIAEIKENFLSSFNQIKDRVLDSSAYNQLRDLYENLTPAKQKGALALTGVLVLSFFMYWPLSFLMSSSEYISEFESKRDLIRELLQVSKEASEVPAISPALALSQIQSTIESYSNQANFMPEQINGVSQISNLSKLVPVARAEGALKVQYSKLNLDQILRISQRLQNLGTAVKMTSMQIEANQELPLYFDLALTFVALKVPSLPPPSRKNFPSTRSGKNSDRRKFNRTTPEDE